MKERTVRYRRLLVLSFLLLAVLGCGVLDTQNLPTVTPTQAPSESEAGATPGVGDRQIRQNLVRSTVQIIALREQDGRLQPLWTGSGTILSPDGLILTNAHVVHALDPEYQPDALGVAITVRSDQPPEPRYLAEVGAIDVQLDLAVIQITSDLDGRPIDTEELNLSHVSIGNSDRMELGDLVWVLGYPGIGGETITFTEGSVSGFSRERGVEGRAWIKTDATIAGGNSGGLAANASGEVIGVPTEVGYGGGERVADCRYLADTNGDGVIDENDSCIPVGGFINALRPVNLAAPLIEAARAGIAPQPSQPSSPASTGEPRFSNLVFAPDVTENDQPSYVATQLPSGTTDIYVFWDYEDMYDGAIWEARWYYEGELIEAASQPPQPWQGGERGNWWVSVYNSYGLEDGAYRVELYVEEELLAEGEISVGGGAATPVFTDLIFSEGISDDEAPTEPSYLLPSGITEVYAFFDYENMRDGASWSRVWTYQGRELARGSATWDAGASGSSWIGLSADAPLDPGTYRLEIYVEDSLVAASNFVLAGTRSQASFGPITFASGVGTDGEPVDPGTTFPSGLEELHFFSSYVGMADGVRLGERWLLDGEELLDFEVSWEGGESGTFHDLIYHSSGQPLPDGEYTMELYVGGQLVQQATAVVGTGAAPTPEPPPTDGLYIQGYILDADTGRGIPGAVYLVLDPGVTVDSWDGSDDQVYTWAETDADGYFELPDPLERGQRYTFIAGAEAYRPAFGEDLLVGDEASPLEVEITLQKE